MHEPSDGAPRRRTHCPGCGTPKAKKWGEARSTLTKFCPNDACNLFGIPQLVSVAKVVTIDRLGREHVGHRELASDTAA